MSYSQRVLQAMNFGREYSPEEIAATTKIDQSDVSQCLHLLQKGGGNRVCAAFKVSARPEV